MPHAGHGGRWGTRDGGWTLHLHMGGMGDEERRVDCKPAHGGDGGQGTEGGLYTCTWGGGMGDKGRRVDSTPAHGGGGMGDEGWRVDSTPAHGWVLIVVAMCLWHAASWCVPAGLR